MASRQISISTKSRDILFDPDDNRLWIKSPSGNTYHMGRVVNEIERGLLLEIKRLREELLIAEAATA